MSKRRVVVTGMGMLSPLGNDVATSWQNAVAGKSGIDYVTRFDTEGFSARIGGEIKGLEMDQFIDRKEVRKMDRFTQYGLVSSIEAVQDSGLDT